MIDVDPRVVVVRAAPMGMGRARTCEGGIHQLGSAARLCQRCETLHAMSAPGAKVRRLMTGLVRAVYAVAKTKRRRFLWCVWWTGEPMAKPFRPPDAWGGGARTEQEARRLAERAAGMPLDEVDGHWAGAWKRMRAGRPPFPRAPSVVSGVARPTQVNPYTLLEVEPTASLDELKAAFRKKAVLHHPDRGGNASEFIAVKRAYDAVTKRRARRGEP